MIGKRLAFSFSLILIVALCLTRSSYAQTLPASGSPAAPVVNTPLVGESFTYQGHLSEEGQPATGNFDFSFELYDASSAGNLLGTVTLEEVPVSQGLFTVSLDFGAPAFNGQDRWLAIGVRPGSEGGAFTPLDPRQAISAAPYASYAVAAGSLSWGGLSDVPAGFADNVDNDTTYTAGTGLLLSGTQFSVDTTLIQARIGAGCAAGQAIRLVQANGTVTCQEVDAPHSHYFLQAADGTPAQALYVDADGRVGIGTTAPGEQLEVAGNIYASGQFVSAVVSGTAPLVISSTLLVANLNADLLDGHHASELQTRVNGSCQVGSSIRAIHEDGSVTCWSDAPLNRAAIPAANTYTTVDSAGSVGLYPSITIGPDGLPLISYTDQSNLDLKVLHCGNLACNSDNTLTTVDSSDNIGWNSSIAIGSDGLPIISYDDDTNDDLKVAHCGNLLCNDDNTITTVDAPGDVGHRTSIVIGADGLAVISYWDIANLDLKFVHCGNLLCNSDNTITTVDSAGDLAHEHATTLGVDGLAIISYWDATNADLKVLHCGNALCNSGNTITTVDSAGEVGRDSSITIGADGLPVISYTDGTALDYALKVLHCGNLLCTGGNTATTVDNIGTVGYYSNITIGTDGLPIISYLDITNFDLKVVHCGNVGCNSGNLLLTLDSSGNVGDGTAITIGADGLPVIGYLDDGQGDLKVLHCSNLFCAPYFRRR